MAGMLTGEEDDDVSYYTYSMSESQAVVKSGVLPVSNEHGLLSQAKYVPLDKSFGNYTYVVYEHRYICSIPFIVKVVSTPVTVAVDAVIVGVGVPAAVVVYVLFIAPAG